VSGWMGGWVGEEANELNLPFQEARLNPTPFSKTFKSSNPTPHTQPQPTSPQQQ